MREGLSASASKGGAKKAMQSNKHLVGKYFTLLKMLRAH